MAEHRGYQWGSFRWMIQGLRRLILKQEILAEFVIRLEGWWPRMALYNFVREEVGLMAGVWEIGEEF